MPWLPLEQVTKQLHKLIHVIKITELAVEESVEREVMLIRVRGGGRMAEVMDAAAPFDVKVADAGAGSVVFEVAAHPRDLAAFLETMRPFGVVDLVKSGRLAITREIPVTVPTGR